MRQKEEQVKEVQAELSSSLPLDMHDYDDRTRQSRTKNYWERKEEERRRRGTNCEEKKKEKSTVKNK